MPRDCEPGWEKPCTDCGQPINIKDRHKRCQKCRRMGGYIKWPPSERGEGVRA